MKRGAGFASSRRQTDMFDIPIHRLIVHFPIALTLVALSYDMRALYLKRPDLHDIGYKLSLWSAGSAILAIATGFSRAGALGLDSGALAGHTGFAISAGLVLTGFAVLRYTASAGAGTNSRYYPAVWSAVQLLGFLLIAASAITGHGLFG